ncbi:MAG: chromate transporter [Desulfobaccales bacterium]
MVFPASWNYRVWRTCGPHRDDGGRGGPAPAVGYPGEIPRFIGGRQPDPRPSSTEMAIFIGYLCKGWAGLLLAGLCFIVPAMVIVLGFAWAYVRFGILPQIAWLLYGVKPVVIAIILQALWQLGRTAVKSKLLRALAIIAVVLDFRGSRYWQCFSAPGCSRDCSGELSRSV